jgi:hypothetical protein
MKTVRHRSITGSIIAALVLLATAASARPPAEHPLQDAASQKVLDAMGRTSTWGHPDQYGEFSGMQHYAAGHYKAAMTSFLLGARYADKLSQLSIGLMYLNGQGVQKDPVEAFAWVAIAAERKYPQFIETRDGIWSTLNAAQRAQAKVRIDALYAEYGDQVAKPRMARALRWSLAEATGFELGYDRSGSVISLSTNNPPPACGAQTIDGAPITGCGDLYAESRWNPKKYFQSRDDAWVGTVSVGKLQAVKADGKAPAPASSASPGH